MANYDFIVKELSRFCSKPDKKSLYNTWFKHERTHFAQTKITKNKAKNVNAQIIGISNTWMHRSRYSHIRLKFLIQRTLPTDTDEIIYQAFMKIF